MSTTMTPSRTKDFLNLIPWWLLAIGGLVTWLVAEALSSELYRQILSVVSDGIGVSVFVSLVALVYVVMTLALSLALRALERRLRAHERR